MTKPPDARTVQPGQSVTYHNEPWSRPRPRRISDPRQLEDPNARIAREDPVCSQCGIALLLREQERGNACSSCLGLSSLSFRLTDDDLKAFEFFGKFEELPSKIRECIGKAVAEIRERRAADISVTAPDARRDDQPANCIKCGEPLGGAGYGYPVAAPDGCRWLPGRAHGRCMIPRERHAEFPRWTPFISPDLVTLVSECNHDRGDEDGDR